MNKIINKILSLFRDESEELEAMRDELRHATAECAALVSGIKFYAAMPDSQESRQALLKYADDTAKYGRFYQEHVDELKGELETLKRTVRLSTVGR